MTGNKNRLKEESRKKAMTGFIPVCDTVTRRIPAAEATRTR
jgi:hypothetical protein